MTYHPTTTPTTEQRHARLILARLNRRGPSTAAELAGDGVPRVETDGFARAFALLTQGRLIRCTGTRQTGRVPLPVFEVTGAGRRLAMHLPPAP